MLGAGGNSKAVIRHAKIQGAVKGISDDAGYTADSLCISDVEILGFSTAAIYLAPIASDTLGYVNLQDVTIDMGNAPYGVYISKYTWVAESYDVYMDLVKINYDGEPGVGRLCGAVLNTMGIDGATPPQINDLWVAYIESGPGVWIADCAPDITNLYVENCKTGVEIWGDAAPDIEMDPANDYGILNVTTGIYVDDSAEATIHDFGIDGATTGVWTEGTSGSEFTDGHIKNTWMGFKSYTDSAVRQDKIRDVFITDFSYRGVGALKHTSVDLGTVADPGNNAIHATNPTQFIYVRYCVSGADLMAEKNWWGSSTPSSSMFSTCVDYSPLLYSAPAGMSDAENLALEVKVTVPQALLLGNPVHSQAMLQLSIPDGMSGESVVDVYDVRGRLVRSLCAEMLPAGETRLQWDGKNEGGVDVASGVYFIRVQIPGYEGTKRLALVR